VTDHQGQAAPAAGWYTDPTGQAGVRWWDGGRWTAYTAPTPAGRPGPVVTGRPPLAPETPVYTPFIWVIVLLPLVSYVSVLLWRPEFRFTRLDGVRTIDPLSIYTPAYIAVQLLSLVLYGLTVLFAALDHRALVRAGVVRPFHWAWAFLNGLVYVIGRSVIVRQVARPRGLLPIWITIAVMAVGLAVGIIWMSLFFGAMMSQIPTDLGAVS
jgi:hypothetical protein